jgi:hypothetical protein
MRYGELLDATVHDGLWDACNDYHMGRTGGVVAERWRGEPRGTRRMERAVPSARRRGRKGRRIRC